MAFRILVLVVLAVTQARVLVHALQLRNVAKEDLLVNMHPELVNKILSEVQDQWLNDVVKVKNGKMTELASFQKMQKSCTKISKSILSGSEGDEDRVQEYMDSVCAVNAADSPNAERCDHFRSALLKSMNHADAEFNRDGLDTVKFCENFYKQDVEAEAAEQVKKFAAEATEAKKKADEQATRMANAAADAKRIADEHTARNVAAEKKHASENSVASWKAADAKSEEATQKAEVAEEEATQLTERNNREMKAQEENMADAEKNADKLMLRARAQMEAAERTEMEQQKKEAIRKVEEHHKSHQALQAAKLEAAKAEAQAAVEKKKALLNVESKKRKQ